MSVRTLSGLFIAVGLSAIIAPSIIAGSSASPMNTFLVANEQYHKEAFDQAIAGYEAILEKGQASGALYYNLGNAYLKEGLLGKARWAYLRSQQYMPRDADLQANLAHTASLLGEGAAKPWRAPPLLRWFAGEGHVAETVLLPWSLVLLWLAVAGRVLITWNTLARRILKSALVIVALLSVWSGAALASRAFWHAKTAHAVVIHAAVDVRYAPQQSGTTHFTLKEGNIIRTLDQQGEWVQIQRVDGRAGWLPAESVKAL